MEAANVLVLENKMTFVQSTTAFSVCHYRLRGNAAMWCMDVSEAYVGRPPHVVHIKTIRRTKPALWQRTLWDLRVLITFTQFAQQRPACRDTQPSFLQGDIILQSPDLGKTERNTTPATNLFLYLSYSKLPVIESSFPGTTLHERCRTFSDLVTAVWE